jgi:hypothetical protein
MIPFREFATGFKCGGLRRNTFLQTYLICGEASGYGFQGFWWFSSGKD